MPQTDLLDGSTVETAQPELLLATKLYIPPPRPGSVARGHLLGRLEAGIRRRPGVTLISAPPGSGKTTLLSQWVYHVADKGESAPKVGWLSLDEEDNRPRRFLSYGLAALRQIQPSIGHNALDRLADHSLTPETFLTPLINEMMGIDTPFIFVLDDYHVIETPLIHQGLAFVLDHLPPQGHLVIASRVDVPFSLVRLRARGQLTELSAKDLAFTPHESADFLNRTMGLSLSPREIEALETRTEGWIAGLQMAALSMQGVQDTASFVRAFTGSHRYILDYLMEEVLQRQSETVQNFLLRTSILQRLTASLCDALLETNAPLHSPPHSPISHNPSPVSSLQLPITNYQSPVSNLQSPPSQTLLQQLEQANLFVIPLDDERRWYRYHHLFADLLRDRLNRQVDEAEVVDLHRRASDWFRDHGFATEAMSHALSALDTQRIVALVRERAATFVSQGEFMAMLSWLEHLPPEISRTWARVPLLPVWAVVLTGQFDAVEARLQDIEQQIGVLDDRDAVLGEVAAIRAFAAYFQRDMTGAIALCRTALDKLPDSNPFLRGIVVQSLGAALAWSGRSQQAAAAFAEAVSINRRVKNWETVLMAEWSLASAQTEQGFLRQALETHRQTLVLASSEAISGTLESSPYLCRAYLGLAEILYQQNQLAEAKQYLDLGHEALLAGGDEGMRAAGDLIAARLKQAQGDLDGALDAVRHAKTLAQQHLGPFYWSEQIATYHIQLWLMDDNVEAVKAWLVRRNLWPVAAATPVSYAHETEYLLQARFGLAHGRAALQNNAVAVGAMLSAVNQTLGGIISTAKNDGRSGRVIEALILQALVYQAQHQSDTALNTLGEALSLAAPEDIVRMFIDEGEMVAELLRTLVAARTTTPYRAYANKLLTIFESSSASSPPLLDPLSERELEILRLTATGLSNKQLAENLVLTVGTVKWHLNNIYSKLGVRSRTEAVARARELGLL